MKLIAQVKLLPDPEQHNALKRTVEYKAQLAGVPVVAVDPRNTSRTCPFCGYLDKHNRPNQVTFSCIQCGFSGPADYVAALNIGCRGAVSRPNVSDTLSSPQRQGQSPRL